MEEMNSRITDQMLDELITTSLHRQQVVEDISQDVMKELDSSTHRAWLRKWGRIAAFSFGIPMVLLTFGWLLYSFLSHQNKMSVYYLCLIIPVVVMIYVVKEILEKFSVERT